MHADLPASIGPYPINALLGEGAVARVYAGVDPRDQRPVAIKVLREGHSPEHRTLERFLVEIDTVRRLRHRNIIDVFDFGALPDGRPYFVMEHLPGLTLQQRIEQDGPLTFLEAAPIFTQACDALEAAHAAGVIHRDLKPDNVYLVTDPLGGPPQVKLLDFGIAKLAAKPSSAGLTQAGATVGTPLYMSPEQIRALPLDARSDIYTLGIALFQCLTGEVPFYADSHAQTATMHLGKPAPRPSQSGDMPIPEQADHIVLRCLEKNPDNRYESVGALRVALEGAVQQLMSVRQLSGSRPLPRALLPSIPPLPPGTPGALSLPLQGMQALSEVAALVQTSYDTPSRGLPSIPPLPGRLPIGYDDLRASGITPRSLSGEHGRVPLPSIPPLPPGSPGGPGLYASALGPLSGEHGRVRLPSIPPLPPGSPGNPFAVASGEHPRVALPSVPPMPGRPGVTFGPYQSTTGEYAQAPADDENITTKMPVRPADDPPPARPGWLSVVVLVVAAALIGWLGWLLAGTNLPQ